MTEFTPGASLAGGALIGLAVLVLWNGSGRIGGISGIVGGLLGRGAGEAWRWLFLSGLVLGASLVARLVPQQAMPQLDAPTVALVVAGALVGIGTRLGNGCTSGHGVCGVSRGAPRSLIATLVFFAVAVITVYVVRHVAGIGR